MSDERDETPALPTDADLLVTTAVDPALPATSDIPLTNVVKGPSGGAKSAILRAIPARIRGSSQKGYARFDDKDDGDETATMAADGSNKRVSSSLKATRLSEADSLKDGSSEYLSTELEGSRRKRRALDNESDGRRKRRIALAALFVFLSISLLVILVVVLVQSQKGGSGGKNSNDDDQKCRSKRTVMISLDGFKPEYLTEEYQSRWNISTPNLDGIRQSGVSVRSMTPVFPSLTFPNHYSIVTGLYPGWHGIVHNSFWDDQLEQQFQMSTEDIRGEWYRGSPLWQTVRSDDNADLDLKSATIFWVGSDSNCSGNGYPDWYLPYNGSVSYEKRVRIMSDLVHDGDYQLILGYFDEPDHTSHTYGPNSNETAQKVQMVDYYIGQLIESISDVSDQVNLIVVSDHGHAQTPIDQRVLLNSSVMNVFNSTLWFVTRFQPVFALYLTDEGRNDPDIQNDTHYLTDLFRSSLVNDSQSELFQVWAKGDEIPYEYTHSYHGRIPDVTAVPRAGWTFQWVDYPEDKQYWLSQRGQHGYNNSAPEMAAVFLAQGPGFKEGYLRDDPMYNLDVYPLVCRLVCDMEPGPHNGSLERVTDLLSSDDSS